MAIKTAGIEIRKPDAQGRIAIGKEFANESYLVEPQSNGDIILRPVVVMHKQEAWLFANPAALASVRLGLDQAVAGETHDLGSFAQYASEDEED